ncbi:hypothetical protein ZEAMMB73_Zm00001d039376 [Zea mays]|uniref:Uncharacterized protein n=1 Tax=Zea mays TaxID=4577 RepID=A0A1D6MG01_MAIZE|nr:hypothetical protein ZEAMMB73_Zm00001d039376 [Zea mays]
MRRRHGEQEGRRVEAALERDSSAACASHSKRRRGSAPRCLTVAMDGDAFDLNSQAPETDGFPGLQLYGNILSDSDGLFDGRASGSVLPPYRPPCAGGGDARAATAAPYARQLLFDGSTSRGRQHSSSAGELGRSSTRPSSTAQQHSASSHQQPRRTASATTEGTEGSEDTEGTQECSPWASIRLRRSLVS